MRPYPFRLFVGIALSSAAIAIGCGGSPLQPDLPDKPAEAGRTEQSNLLLFPHSAAEELLGRAVRTTTDGKWTIADARAPGCEVAVQKEVAVYTTKRQVDLRSMT